MQINSLFRFKKLLAFSLVTVFSTFAFGWGDLGHETVAQVAELILKSDPNVLQKVHDIIGVEPMAMAATWPDHARNDDRFLVFADYHFITMFENPGQHNEKDSLVVLKKYTALLTDQSVPREVKMIALRYILHVAGDVHQPLHVGNEFDRGGNDCKVKWQPNPKNPPSSYNLHSVWDGALVSIVSDRIKAAMPKPPKYFGYKEVAPALMERHKDIVGSRPLLDVDVWVQESSQLSKNGGVYPPDNLPPNQRPYCKRDESTIRPEDVPTLDQAYAQRSADLVEKRLVLGGVRLAALLKQILGGQPTTGPTEQQVFSALDIKNQR